MSDIHGVFQHRSGYYYTILEEDFCEVFKGIDAEGKAKNEVCRAFIASIFEQLTNKQYEGVNTDIWIYISIPEIVRRMRNAYKERTVHKELQGLIDDGYIEKRRSHKNGATMEYKLNIARIRKELAALPDKGNDTAKMQDDDANLQDQSCKNTRSSCKNDSIDLANLQARIKRDSQQIHNKNKQTKESAPASDQAENPSLFSSDFLLTEPEMKGAWNSEKVIQYAEHKNGYAYSPAMRSSQLAAAKYLHSKDASLTLEQFKAAFDERFDAWWIERKKALHVTDMKAKEQSSGIVRLYAMLERIEAGKSKKTAPRSSQASTPQQEQPRTHDSYGNTASAGKSPLDFILNHAQKSEPVLTH